jgi:hypothetical protein
MRRFKSWTERIVNRRFSTRFYQEELDYKKAAYFCRYFEENKHQLPYDKSSFEENFNIEKEYNSVITSKEHYNRIIFNNCVSKQILSMFQYIDAKGGLNPYPPPLSESKLTKYGNEFKEAADKELGDVTIGEYKEGSLIEHPLGFSLQIRKSKIDHPESGYGKYCSHYL